jgi:hypothetical protein
MGQTNEFAASLLIARQAARLSKFLQVSTDKTQMACLYWVGHSYMARLPRRESASY